MLPLRQAFSASSLGDVDVLVIANALNRKNVEEEDWWLPTPSAFTPDEIAAVRRWVEAGGSLFLVADHKPFPGAADLAAAFGFQLLNGFVVLGVRSRCARRWSFAGPTGRWRPMP